MTSRRLNALLRVYRDGLLEDTLRFWCHHSVDRRHGGFLNALDRDGSVLDTDKSMWQQCRFTWLLATLHRVVEPRAEWFELARHGVDFIRGHGFGDDGRMFFSVTGDGRPLRTRRDVFAEAYGAMALAAWSKIAEDDDAGRQAAVLFRNVTRLAGTRGVLAPDVDPATRPLKSIGLPMVTINAAQVLRETVDVPRLDAIIDEAIEEIRRDFVRPELECVLETVGADGAFLDHFDGRTLNPGHAVQTAWLILHEAMHRNGEAGLIETGVRMLDWTWARGWDERHGGLLSFVGVDGRPVQSCWHDMKLWWPHTEAIIATLLAWHLTGEERFAERHKLVHDWAHRRFRDPDYGEWFGYLRRDGAVSSTLKGNDWKGPFHVPRMQLYGWKLIERIKAT